MYINLFAIFQQKLNILIKIISGPDRLSINAFIIILCYAFTYIANWDI
jgi:hypothetical protein